MGIKRLEEYIAVQRLENSGIYIFINKNSNKFYVGKSSAKMYDRVKSHLLSSHNDLIYNLANDKGTELYIYPITDFYNNDMFYNEDINFIEYNIMKYLISQGFESINGKDSFSREIRKKYDNYEKLDLSQFIKLEENLFAKNLKEFLLYKKSLKNINCIKKRLKYQFNKNIKLEENILELKCNIDNQKKDYIKTVYEDYYRMKDKIFNLKQENSYLTDKLNVTEKALEKLKETKDIQIKSVEDELYKEIHKKKIEVKNLEYKMLLLEENHNSRIDHNVIIKRVVKNIISKDSDYTKRILAFIDEGTHYRGTKEDYNKYKANNKEIHKLRMLLEDIVNDKNLLFKLNCFNNEEVIYKSISYCCNIHAQIYLIADLLQTYRVKEKSSDNEIQHITIIEKNFINKYNQIIKNIERFKKDLEDKLSNL